MKSWAWGSHGGISTLIRRDQVESHVRALKKKKKIGCLKARKRTLRLWDFSASRTMANRILLVKPPSEVFCCNSPNGLGHRPVLSVSPSQPENPAATPQQIRTLDNNNILIVCLEFTSCFGLFCPKFENLSHSHRLRTSILLINMNRNPHEPN